MDRFAFPQQTLPHSKYILEKTNKKIELRTVFHLFFFVFGKKLLVL